MAIIFSSASVNLILRKKKKSLKKKRRVTQKFKKRKKNMYKAFSIILFLVFGDFTHSQYVNDTLDVSLNRYSDSLQDNNKLFIDFLNPFCPSTETRFNIPVKCESKFTLIDSNGVLIAILFDKELELGQYSLFWNISGLKSGMYICLLTAGDHTDKRNFFLVR